MPIPAHRRVIYSGTLRQQTGGGSEIFAFSHAATTTLSLADGAAAAGENMSTAWEDATYSIFAYNTANLTGCRMEAVSADGKVSDSYYYPITSEPGLQSAQIPSLLAQCLTLETSTAGSHRRMIRGRFYPPACAGGFIGSTCGPNDALIYAQNWAHWMGQLASAGVTPAVASTESGGTIAEVTALTAATVIDTIRRRKNHVVVQRSARQPIS